MNLFERLQREDILLDLEQSLVLELIPPALRVVKEMKVVAKV